MISIEIKNVIKMTFTPKVISLEITINRESDLKDLELAINTFNDNIGEKSFIHAIELAAETSLGGLFENTVSELFKKLSIELE